MFGFGSLYGTSPSEGPGQQYKYFSVPNRRAERNKLAGGKILKKQ